MLSPSRQGSPSRQENIGSLSRLPQLLSASMVLLSVWFGRPGAATADGPGCCAPCAPACCAPCPPPDVCTCTTYKPVCHTCYRPQPLVTYQNICRTCYRQEPYCVTVPVTKVDCVRCDEGCYKMVWCPRIVTRQIPRVEYHQQVCSRCVPYTVSQCVPRCTTQMVPEHRISYCPQTYTYVKPPCCPCPCCPAPACGAPGAYMSQAAPAGYAPQAVASAQMAAPQPTLAVDQAVLSPVPQAVTVPTAGMQDAASANAMNNPYLRARAAANVWQSPRGYAAQ